MDFKPHYARDIDRVNIGSDFGEEGPGWISMHPNAQSYGLLMLLQSLPETRRIVSSYEGNVSFVHRSQDYIGEKARDKAIITINPAPTMDDQTHLVLREKACALLDPNYFENEEKPMLAANTQRIEALHADIETKRQALIAKKAAGEDAESLYDEYTEFEQTQMDKINRLKFENRRIDEHRPRVYGTHGMHPNQFDTVLKENTIAWKRTQAEPFMALLAKGGISFRGPTGDNSIIQIDQNQLDFDAKLSALMDTHREEILSQYKDVDFIIAKPDGTALDKPQAANIIATRRDALRQDEAALDAAAKQYGVTTIEAALSKPKTGFGGRGIVHGDQIL